MRNNAHSIYTFDFSTLYTKIPHDKLKSVMRELINFCFKGGENKYIAVNKFGARWVKEKNPNMTVFDKTSLKLAINFLLDNCFFRVGNLIFRQVIGIPMGTDPAPFMANLFLYFYENKWATELRKKDLWKARLFSNTFRFIDDLCALNDKGEFEKCCSEIYPPELELKKENLCDQSASFLDLEIFVNRNKFETKLYDKRDAFPFQIVRMPYSDSNIPTKIFYASISSEILRLAKTTSTLAAFINSSNTLLKRMKCQGSKSLSTKKLLRKLYNQHPDNFKKFANNAAVFVSLFNI